MKQLAVPTLSRRTLLRNPLLQSTLIPMISTWTSLPGHLPNAIRLQLASHVGRGVHTFQTCSLAVTVALAFFSSGKSTDPLQTRNAGIFLDFHLS